MADVYLIYTKPGCTYCEQAKAILNSKSIPYRVENLDTWEKQVDFMAKVRPWRTFPAIFTLNEDGSPKSFLGGYTNLQQALAGG